MERNEKYFFFSFHAEFNKFNDEDHKCRLKFCCKGSSVNWCGRECENQKFVSCVMF
jgi:hypothetical protein